MKLEKILKPAFFDIFGIVVFTFLIWVGYTNLNAIQPLNPTLSMIILLIGIAGLIVDTINVFRTYIK